ncbi:Aste57867_2177 [Aphanomyces stellatus]|uniref:Aste57867_2177 protein n=1 Tax=Aphanomyces stellatus TaxID=120398 RepID=A0A485KCL2_9STRA|nr:hypothetical protein As57867_002172 [Aphanomyces stellatus]VFT79380.1 Aste57867_2177 [Aphanomyces stellatus]
MKKNATIKKKVGGAKGKRVATPKALKVPSARAKGKAKGVLEALRPKEMPAKALKYVCHIHNCSTEMLPVLAYNSLQNHLSCFHADEYDYWATWTSKHFLLHS